MSLHANTRRKKSLKKTPPDYEALFCVIFLVIFGIIMVFSASSYTASIKYGNAYFFAIRQLRAAAIGLVGLIVASCFPYQQLKRFSKPLLMISIALLILVLILGSVVNGSARWLRLGAFSFQPSEIAKLSVILYMAQICSTRYKEFDTLKGTATAFLFPGIMIILIALENLSTAMICCGIAFVIWFMVTPKIRYALALIAGGAVFLIMMISLKGYRSERIVAWKNPEASDKGYQTMQALYAIGSGRWFGKGLGNSVLKRGFIPEAQNDMIFAVICEELGVFGGLCIILLFVYLLWRLKRIADQTYDTFGALIVVGIMAHIACQTILNIAVVTNVIPNTGVTLPFISYGGTSLSIMMTEMGIALSASRQPQKNYMLSTREISGYVNQKRRSDV